MTECDSINCALSESIKEIIYDQTENLPLINVNKGYNL